MSLKPPVPRIIPGHSLYTGCLGLSALSAGSGVPSNIVSGTPVAATFVSGTGGTWADPVWQTDATFGAYLKFAFVAGVSHTNMAQFPAYATKIVSGHLAALVRLDANSDRQCCFANAGGSTGGYGDFLLATDSANRFVVWARGVAQLPTSPIVLTVGKWYALAATFDFSNSTLTWYAKNLTDNTAVQTATKVMSDTSFTQIHTANQVWGLGFAGTGFEGNFSVGEVDWGSNIWSPSNFDTFAADPYGLMRPTLLATPSSVAGGVSNQAIRLVSNVGSYTNGSPGSPVLTATGATLNTPQTVSGGNTVDLSVASTGSSGNTIVITDPDYQVSASVAVTSASATDFTVTPPSPASGNIGSPSADFTVAVNGTYTGTATIADGGAGGSSSGPPSWSSESASKTFKYTPQGLAQTIMLTVTLPGLGSKTVTYTSLATTLLGGNIARQSGTLTSLTIDGHAGYGVDNADTPSQPGGAVASGGQGTLAYAWFLLPRADTPLTGSPGTLIAGQTGADLTLTGLTRFARYILVRRVTDGVGAVAWSNVVVASTLCDFTLAPVVGCDSQTANMNKSEFKSQLQGASNTEHIKYLFDASDKWCAGLSGATSGNWRSDATSPPSITGADSVARTLLLNACYVAASITADIKALMYMAGDNDAIHGGPLSPATFKANVQDACAYALAHGFDLVVLEHPTDTIAGPSATPAMRAAIVDYCDQLDSLDNGVNIFATGNKSHLMTAGRVDQHDNGAGSITDAVHFNTAGYRGLSRARANALTVAVDRFIRASGAATSATSAIIKSGQRRRGR